MEIEEEEERTAIDEYKEEKDDEFETAKKEAIKERDRKNPNWKEEINYPKQFGDPLPGGGFVGNGTTPYRCLGAPGEIYDYS